MLIMAGALIALFIGASITAPFWINWLWFGSMGYRSIIVTNYTGVILNFLVGGLLAAGIFIVNVRFAVRNTRNEWGLREGSVGRFSKSALNFLGLVFGGVLFVFVGWISKDFWRDVWLAMRADEFGIVDPTFNRDVSFYVFTLPVLKGVQNSLMWIVGITIVAVALVYLVRLGVRFGKWDDVPMVALRHLSGLACAMLLLIAFGYVLRNFELVYSTRGVVIGPGFTDVNIVRPLNWMMAFLSAATAIGLLSGIVLRTPRWLVGLLGGWFVLAVLVTPLLPVLVQQFFVEPNEFRREEQYIARNIDMTLAGFALDDVEVTELTGQDPIVPAELPADEPPLSNVRVWDYRVVQPVYQQLQTFVPYYEFDDIDVDWYMIDGQPVQVLISARELNIDGLRENARTWTNRRLAYTHGYGAVVSPVSQVSGDGWPVMTVSGIPPVGPPELAIDRPEIYFGELPQEWIITNTDQTEFTGIDESLDAGGFEGTPAGSISLGNPFTRALAGLTLGDRNVFVSGQLTGDSRLVMTRSVVDRAERIAPFFSYDEDPYLVIADGELYWIIDGYTSTDRFPQATRYDGVNYLRNSVKVVVNAYDGDTTFYRTAEADPIADAYGEVYGDLFTPVAEAPASISQHFRYPEREFRLQSDVWSTYHVDSARTLYDGDDQWIVAQQELDGTTQPVEPYFVTQQLPNESETEFALTVPFTPGGGQARQNMTAWFAGTADETGATRLRQYRYPRQVTVFGPTQIDAQIDQDPEISQQITLWNQSGTEVIRGNMLVIPVNDAMLYIQPLYLQSRDSAAAAPKLVRVIVATDEQVVMRPTLPEAIAALADPDAATVGEIEDVPDAVTETVPVDQEAESDPADVAPPPSGDFAGMTEGELADEALASFDRAQAALQAGDFATYGEEQDRLGQILEALTALDGEPPEATPES
ncbi:MAG: UPF0182 family protein [Chloroflexia bacterium]|nr:UPF0182 family protein [Chloroflexia bacterium]